MAVSQEFSANTAVRRNGPRSASKSTLAQRLRTRSTSPQVSLDSGPVMATNPGSRPSSSMKAGTTSRCSGKSTEPRPLDRTVQFQPWAQRFVDDLGPENESQRTTGHRPVGTRRHSERP